MNKMTVLEKHSDRQLDMSLTDEERAESHLIAKYMAIGIETAKMKLKLDAGDIIHFPDELYEFCYDYGIL